MADDSIFGKFKAAFTEDPPKPKTAVRDLDPNKAKSFSSVFNEEYGSDNAISRRLNQIKKNR